MIIRSVRHKGLRSLLESGDTSGLQPQVVDKVIKILAFLQDMKDETELRAVPTWKAHRLTGDRKGIWSLFVTKNWRITFAVDRDEVEVIDLDYEDYH